MEIVHSMNSSDSKKDQTARHVVILQESYRRCTGRYLFNPKLTASEAVVWLEQAPFALVSHGTQPDPVFNYGNQTALQLFGMSREEFIRMPSRLSAEPLERTERERLLERVLRDGYIDNYTGIRIAADGRRFLIRHATVWNLLDETGQFYGQAAVIPKWDVLQTVFATD